jgi:hypothetical protein
VRGQVRPLNKLQRERADRPQIDGNILADCAVSACGAPHKSPGLVDQFDRQAVEFRLGGIDNLLGFQLTLHAGVERADIVLVGNRVETQHRFLVRDLGEFRQRRRTDALGRRIAGDQVGMGGFEIDQFAKEPVVFRVGNFGSILRVIEMVVSSDFSTERGKTLFDVTAGHGLVTHG